MSVMKTILVISYDGENPDEIANIYAADNTCENYIVMRREDAGKEKKRYLKEILKVKDNKCLPRFINMSALKKHYYEVKSMTDDEFFYSQTCDCEYTDNKSAAYTNANRDARYKYPKCYHEKLVKTGYEAEFSNPFWLNTDHIAYRAHFDEINWKRMHGFNKPIYRAAWEICVEGREPKNDRERTIQQRMGNRERYFIDNFTDKEDYVTHSTSFFTWGIATSEKFICMDDWDIDEKKFVKNFYKKYIKTLEGNPLLSIYEVRVL